MSAYPSWKDVQMLFEKGIAGGLKKWEKYFSSRNYLGPGADFQTIICSINTYSYSASCHCLDPLLVAGVSNHLNVYRSKQYGSKKEADLALEADMHRASKKYPNIRFYKYRYYPEHDAMGEFLFCENGSWFEGDEAAVERHFSGKQNKVS